MSESQKTPFSKLRSYLWPVHAYELRKFLPLLLMAFFIGFNYNILRNMKDALLVTAEASGAEVIPFIKVWGIVPGAFLITFIYSRLNNRLTRNRVFYTMVTIFLIFFALFTFVIFPMREIFHLHRLADSLSSVLPAGCMGLIAMIRYWTFSAFYIMGELWSSTILSMLFWGFCNEVTRLGEAKRFYGLIAIGLNIAAIVSGQFAVFLTGSFLYSHFPIKSTHWEHSLALLTATVILCGFLVMLIYRYLTNHVLEGDDRQNLKEHKGKIKMSMRENFLFLSRSKYLLYIAIIVLSYNVVINLVEVIWKDQVKMLYPHPNDYTSYMSHITTFTGIISLFASIFISGQMIRRFGWTLSALVTPLILLSTSIGFFLFFFGRNSLGGLVAQFGTSPLILVVLFGSIQNCFCRAAKFTLFDATKEMAFIPLSMESKLKGKAAIDGVGSRLGKSGGSLIHQGLLMVFTTISASTTYVAGILLGVIVMWMFAIKALGKRFNILSATLTTTTVTVTESPSGETMSEKPELHSSALQ
ncbi:MAG: NTP/NDP exchange transporter [Chlamydiia bacterium]|nr:NTP/NDP exchange transporter [Chlamydiia bacterium]